MALFRNSPRFTVGVNHALRVTGLESLVRHKRVPPRNAADFLELAKNCTFLDRKLISARYETADGHFRTSTDPDRLLENNPK